MQDTIWYQSPAKVWMDGLPIGNGRLAAMVWGEQTDIVTMNHEYLWRGEHRNRENFPVAPEALSQIRSLIENGDYFRATALANVWLGGRGGIGGVPRRIDGYQPGGELCFAPQGTCGFVKRELNLLNGVCRSERTVNGAALCMTAFADAAGGAVVCRWESDAPVSGRLLYRRVPDEHATEHVTCRQDTIRYDCSFHGGISFSVLVSYQTDGAVSVEDNSILICNATKLTTQTDIFVWLDGQKEPTAIEQFCYDTVLGEHCRIFRREMERFSLSVDLPESDEPTDKRVEALRRGEVDDALVLLFFRYGRYLLLSSSLCGALPANLQGKWNDAINTPWGADYHLNINLQMNYWIAEPTNCPTCADSLLKLIDSFIPHGKQAAKELYGCRGIWLPHATDVWGHATPESFGWAVWIGAAPWLAQHYYNHYLYTGDKEFLRERCYPFLKEVALFYEDYLVRDADGVYQIMPSQSPENAFEGVGMFPAAICKSAAMDVQLAYMALGYAADAADVLETDAAEAAHWRDIRAHLPAFQIGSDGRLMEWNEAFTEREPGHRHVSHLFGVYPGDLFTSETRTAQYEAAKKSLDYRLAQGGGHTGWSRAWVACLYARFGDGEKLYEHITEMMKEFATVSLLDTHPIGINGKPGFVFQIDGNLGASAAVLEAVAQARDGKLHLLYALPHRWKNGSMQGLKTPGGHTVNLVWENGRLKTVAVTMGYANRITLAYAEKEYILTGETGSVQTLTF